MSDPRHPGHGQSQWQGQMQGQGQGQGQGSSLRPSQGPGQALPATAGVRSLAASASLEDIARRNGVSVEAAAQLLQALVRSGGSMAQFNHPELGGSGQWMRGGMTMVSDFGNHGLKARVDHLCNDLLGLVQVQMQMAASASRAHAQGSGPWTPTTAHAAMSSHAPAAPMPPVSPMTGQAWWPGHFGSPSGSGSQNDVRYAWFADAARLVVDHGGRIRVFDTGAHRITGVSQQQSSGASVTFSTSAGPLDLSALREVTDERADPAHGSSHPRQPLQGARGGPVAAGHDDPHGHEAHIEHGERGARRGHDSGSDDGGAVQSARAADTAAAAPHAADDVLATIERLHDLHRRGILSAEEFSASKADLLRRL